MIIVTPKKMLVAEALDLSTGWMTAKQLAGLLPPQKLRSGGTKLAVCEETVMRFCKEFTEVGLVEMLKPSTKVKAMFKSNGLVQQGLEKHNNNYRRVRHQILTASDVSTAAANVLRNMSAGIQPESAHD